MVQTGSQELKKQHTKQILVIIPRFLYEMDIRETNKCIPWQGQNFFFAEPLQYILFVTMAKNLEIIFILDKVLEDYSIQRTTMHAKIQ